MGKTAFVTEDGKIMKIEARAMVVKPQIKLMIRMCKNTNEREKPKRLELPT